MPHVQITWVEGRTPDQKRKIADRITQARTRRLRKLRFQRHGHATRDGREFLFAPQLAHAVVGVQRSQRNSEAHDHGHKADQLSTHVLAPSYAAAAALTVNSRPFCMGIRTQGVKCSPSADERGQLYSVSRICRVWSTWIVGYRMEESPGIGAWRAVTVKSAPEHSIV